MTQDIVEILAALFGVAGVWLTIRENIWCWPVGLLWAAAYLYIFAQQNQDFAANAALHGLYIVTLLYGWYHWLHGNRRQSTLVVTRLTRRLGIPLFIGGVFAAGALGWWRDSRGGDSEMVYWDAATMVFSIVATWMNARKILEVWYVWIAVDLVYLGMFIYVKWLPSAALYTVFLIMAVLGLKAWRASMLAAAAPESADPSNQ